MRVKRLTSTFLWVGLFCFFACQSPSSAPDVSHIQVQAKVERFDSSFFLIDTLNFNKSLAQLQTKHPGFTNDFYLYVLGAGPAADSNLQALPVTASFLRTYWQVKDTIWQAMQPFANIEDALRQSYQYASYYFPQRKLPKPIAFIGPFDAPGIALTEKHLAIGLQQYAGAASSFYQSPEGQLLFPAYISRRFEKQYIPRNAMEAMLNDWFPPAEGNNLISNMIEKGKRWEVLQQLLPNTPDSVITGYTQAQLKWCENNEGLIWNYFMSNADLYTTDPAMMQTYLGESPFTLGMPEASPGNIGAWVGWRLVKQFKKVNGELSPEQLLQLPAKQLFEQAKYKPKA